MDYLIFLGVTLVLFIGFLALTAYETSRGTRIMGTSRSSFDARIERLVFITNHVDFAAYARDLVRVIAARIAHDVVHASLIFVRFLERLLTRIVRALRAERVNLVAAERERRTSDFVVQMKDFKDELRSARQVEEPIIETQE